MTRARYARTLQAVADRGMNAFYTGQQAQWTIAALQAADGIMTLKDLKNYKALSRPTKQVKYRNYKVISGGAPSGGIVALTILNLFKEFENVGDSSQLNLTTHRLDECIRFAYGMVRWPTCLAFYRLTEGSCSAPSSVIPILWTESKNTKAICSPIKPPASSAGILAMNSLSLQKYTIQKDSKSLKRMFQFNGTISSLSNKLGRGQLMSQSLIISEWRYHSQVLLIFSSDRKLWSQSQE
jgi:hypothetical protein